MGQHCNVLLLFMFVAVSILGALNKSPYKPLDITCFMNENVVLLGGVPERSKGSDCKSDGSAFEGSNPSPSTKYKKKLGSGDKRGCSSMVELQPSKLIAWVRFPPPAPYVNAIAMDGNGLLLYFERI
jgi:hypothetical protein